MKIRYAVLVPMLLLSFSCAWRHHMHPDPPAPLPVVPLATAVKDAVSSLDELYDTRTNQDRTHGLVPSEIVVVLQLAAETRAGREAEVGVVFQRIGASAGMSSEVVRSNANTITIRLRSLHFAKKDDLIALMKEKIIALMKNLQRAKAGAPTR